MAQKSLHELNEEYKKELHEYLDKENAARAEHLVRIQAILAEMLEVTKKPPP